VTIIGQVAQHLEAGRAGTDDHRGPQHQGGHRARPQDLAYLGAGGQVPRQPLRIRDDAAQVDDPGQPGVRRLGRDQRGGLPVHGGEVGPGQRVDQVVQHVLAVQCGAHVGGGGHVTGHHLDPIAPGRVGELARCASQHPYRVPGAQQLGHQATADVAGRTEHHTPHGNHPSDDLLR
jgi:hypothetical protein